MYLLTSLPLPPHTTQIELSDHMKKVLRKVRKAKPREQPTEPSTPGFVEKIKQNIKRTDKSEAQGATGSTEVTVHSGSLERKGSFSFMEKVKRPWKKEKGEAPEKEKLLAADGDDKESKDT